MIARLIRRWRDRPDRALRIKAPRVIFEGFDPDSQERAYRRRLQREVERLQGQLLASGPTEES